MKAIIEYDFFLAHAGADRVPAMRFADALRDRGATVFASFDSLNPGDAWDVAIQSAMRRAAVTIVLISANSPNAYYQLEEIADAVQLVRREDADHRVVPIFLSAKDGSLPRTPYGLGRLHALTIRSGRDLRRAVDDLLPLVRGSSISNVIPLFSGPAGSKRLDGLGENAWQLLQTVPQPDESLTAAEWASWSYSVREWSIELRRLLDGVDDIAADIRDPDLQYDVRQSVSAARSAAATYDSRRLNRPSTEREHQRLAIALETVVQTLRALADRLRSAPDMR